MRMPLGFTPREAVRLREKGVPVQGSSLSVEVTQADEGPTIAFGEQECRLRSHGLKRG